MTGRFLLLVLPSILSGCNVGDGLTIETRGDTTLVVANGEGAWGEQRILVEDLRISGAPDRPFAMPHDLAVMPDGDILVHDIQMDQIFRFSADGAYLGTLGSNGQGPGEYRLVNGLAVGPDGRIYVRDQARILVFDGDGTYLDQWPITTSLAYDHMLTATRDGRLALKILEEIPEPFQDVGIGFLLISGNGTSVDTVTGPRTVWDRESESQQGTHPRRHIEWSSLGYPVASVSSRLGFQVDFPDRRVLVVERHVERQPYLDREREEWQEHYEWLRSRFGSRGARILDAPRFKPAYHYMGIARTGEIWLRRALRSQRPSAHRVPLVQGLMTPPAWDEALALEVFDGEGRYLGEISGGPGINVRLISTDSVWGYWTNAVGEQHLMRYVVRPD